MDAGAAGGARAPGGKEADSSLVQGPQGSPEGGAQTREESDLLGDRRRMPDGGGGHRYMRAAM